MKAYILAADRIEETTSYQVVREAHAAQRRLWVDLGPRTPESEALLTEVFRLHPLVIEDIWLDRNLPKLEDLGQYLYVVVHGPRLAPETARTRLRLWVLDLVIGPNFLLSHHDDAELADAVAGDLRASPQLLAEGPAWLAHRLLDRVIDRFLPVIERIGERVDDLETQVIDGAARGEERELTPALFRLKRSIQSLNRIGRHQREVLARLALPGLGGLRKGALPYFRDVADHFLRVSDRAQSSQDALLAVVDAHLSLQSNVLNQTVRRLTAISIVLLPLNLLASIYGMNFEVMPVLGWRYGFWVVIGAMLVIALVLLAWARRQRWL